MNNNEIVLIVNIKSKPDCIEQTKTILQGLLQPTRLEAGSISYVMLQSLTDPTLFSFVEKWQNAAAIKTHEGTAHLQGAFEQLADKLATPPDVRQFTVISDDH